MSRFIVLALLALPQAAFGQEIVSLAQRPGVKQSFLIANMGDRKPEAVALLYVGGEGAINLRMEDGQPKFGQRNFLPRSRREFIRNGIVPVILDVPSDQSAGMTDEFRMSDTHRLDARAVVQELKRRYPGLPVFLVGTSRGTLSAAHVGAGLGEEIAGVVLTASFFQHVAGRTHKRVEGKLSEFKWHTLRVPVLIVHHAQDGCPSTPYSGALKLMRQYQYPLITVFGGKPAESPECEPLAAHGFYGMEAKTVDSIAGWMLGKPYAREIR